MRIHVLERSQRLEGSPEEVFPFFGAAENLEAITPPLLGFTVITPRPIAMGVGTLIEYRLRVHGLPLRWQTLIQEWVPGERFVDVQLRGPYGLWHHTHTFAPTGDGGTLMTDTVHYGIGWGLLGDLAHTAFVRRDIESIFAFRAQAVPALLAAERARR